MSLCVKLLVPCTANCFPGYESDMSTFFFLSQENKKHKVGRAVSSATCGTVEPLADQAKFWPSD
jgi:hypothetical protein